MQSATIQNRAAARHTIAKSQRRESASAAAKAQTPGVTNRKGAVLLHAPHGHRVSEITLERRDCRACTGPHTDYLRRSELAAAAGPAQGRLVPRVGRVAQPPLFLVQAGDERAQMLRANSHSVTLPMLRSQSS